MTNFGTITDTLPTGYRAREFRDSDRETWVEDRNAERHELQQGSADEWRDWEKLDPPKELGYVMLPAHIELEKTLWHEGGRPAPPSFGTA